MKPGKLIQFQADGRGGYDGLDVHGCAFHKVNLAADWEPVETPFQQHERLMPGHTKRALQTRQERRKR